MNRTAPLSSIRRRAALAAFFAAALALAVFATTPHDAAAAREGAAQSAEASDAAPCARPGGSCLPQCPQPCARPHAQEPSSHNADAPAAPALPCAGEAGACVAKGACSAPPARSATACCANNDRCPLTSEVSAHACE